MVGQYVYDNYRIENHDGQDLNSHTYLGDSPRGVPIGTALTALRRRPPSLLAGQHGRIDGEDFDTPIRERLLDVIDRIEKQMPAHKSKDVLTGVNILFFIVLTHTSGEL